MDPPRSKTPTIRKFNPGTFQSDEEVIRQFVVRERELGDVLNVLRDNVDAPSCQHILLVARRGMGKTMLLARVAAELRSGDELSRQLLPVRFMEESHEILDIADFWLETLFYLSKAVAGSDPDFGRELQDTHIDLTTRWLGDSLAERARAVVLDASDRLGRKLMLMVENLQTLCDDVDDDFGWQLRETLQTEPQIILLGTATSRFKGLDEAQEPFFELFRTINLEPLDTEACGRLWHVVSGDEVTTRSIRPLEILTGGSPRLLVIVAEFARHRSFQKLMEELVTLVDDHTEYFRGHLEALPPTERRVYLAVIDLWQPSTTGEIAARARMDVRTVSTLLGRLIYRGAVTYDGTPRKREYAAAERLYSIYYKMRRERDEAAVVHNLIHFMTVFYSEDEMTEMSEVLKMEAAILPSIQEGLERALAESPQFDHILSQEEPAGVGSARTDRGTMKFPKIKKDMDKDVRVAESMMKEAHESVLGSRYEAAVSIFDSVIGKFAGRNAPRLQETVVAALALKASILSHIGKQTEALSAYTQIEERLQMSEIPEVNILVAEAMVAEGNLLRELGKFKEAITAFEAVIKHFSGSAVQELTILAATALEHKGRTLERIGEFEAAIETYDQLIELFGKSKSPGVLVQVAAAMHNKGISQERVGDFKAAIATSELVFERFADYDMPQTQKVVASSLIQKGKAYAELGNSISAINTLDEIVERYGLIECLEIQILVAKALVEKGIVIFKQDDFEKAIKVFDNVFIRFGTLSDVNIQEWVAKALFSKAMTQREFDLNSAIATYDEILERFGVFNELPLKDLVAEVLFNKAETQYEQGDVESSVISYDEYIAQVDDDDRLNRQIQVATAMINRGVAQWNLGNLSEAISSYDLVIERFESSELAELQEVVAKAFLNKGMIQGQLGRPEVEIATYDEMIGRFGDCTDSMVQLWIAKTMINKGVALGNLSDYAGSIETYELIVGCFGDNKTEDFQQIVVMAMINKAIVQGQLGKYSESTATYDAVISRASVARSPWFQGITVRAWVCKADIQVSIGRPAEAQHICDKILGMLNMLEAEEANEIRRQLPWIRIGALLIQKDHTTAMGVFHSVYTSADLNDQAMLQWMIWGVVKITSAGASEHDVLDTLLIDEKKAEVLSPLVIALQKRTGLNVRASAEVNEVAEDIINAIEDATRNAPDSRRETD